MSVTVARHAPERALVDAVAERALSPEPDPSLRAAVSRLVAVCGDSLDGVIFFGSRRTGAAKANLWSAYDLYVVVASYAPFYARLRAAGLVHRHRLWLALLSRWLPPTQLSLRFSEPELHAKVSVIRSDELVRETSVRRHDHFTIGRLFQPVRVEYWRTQEARQAILDALVAAVALTWQWARPSLRDSFDTESYGRLVLATSMAWEVRPEPTGRAAALWAAQRELQLPVFAELLRELEARGELRAIGPAPGSWTVARPAGAGERLRARVYFTRSLVRATARWLKHVATFEDWLEYVVRKASRHTGEPIVLSYWERRWPLLFLWARLVRYFWRKNRRVA